MLKLLACIQKETLLLLRDKVGLLILFILPIFLVFFITLTSATDPKNPPKLNILLYSPDTGDISLAIKKGLKKFDYFTITDITNDSSYTENKAKEAVSQGKYQALVIIPQKTSKEIERYLTELFLTAIFSPPAPPKPLEVFLDPTIPLLLKENIELSIRLFTNEVVSNIMSNAFASRFKVKIQKGSKLNPLNVDVTYAKDPTLQFEPNPVQQYVPSWTLFGMFFIVIPLAGNMVRERAQGVIQRLIMAPISQVSLLLGKIVNYAVINLIQLVLMLAVGVFLLPLFGLDTLNIGGHYLALLLTGIVSSLAAIGFGILIGTFAKTYEQATIVGPFLILIGAAIGGILAPPYLMPKIIRDISFISPLHWAHAAFMKIFLRDANVFGIMPELSVLLLFFAGCLLLSLLAKRNSYSSGSMA